MRYVALLFFHRCGRPLHSSTRRDSEKDRQRLRAIVCGCRRSLWTPWIRRGTTCGGRSVLILVHAVVVRPLTSHPYKAGTEHAGFSPDQARIHQARSPVMNMASRMKAELHPTKNVRQRRTDLAYGWQPRMSCYSYFLVSPLPQTAMEIYYGSASWVLHHFNTAWYDHGPCAEWRFSPSPTWSNSITNMVTAKKTQGGKKKGGNLVCLGHAVRAVVQLRATRRANPTSINPPSEPHRGGGLWVSVSRGSTCGRRFFSCNVSALIHTGGHTWRTRTKTSGLGVVLNQNHASVGVPGPLPACPRGSAFHF